jgi:MFS family permease
MTRAIYQLTVLFLGFGLLTLANGLINSVLVLRMQVEGFALEVSGLVMSAHALGVLIGPFVVPRLLHRTGHIRLFAILAAVISVVTLLHPLLIEVPAWLGLRVVSGFALAGCSMILESWLNHRADHGTRGRVLAVYMIVNYLGFGLGQFLLATGSPASFELFSLAAALFSLALLPIAATRINEPERPEPQVPTFYRLWRLSPLGTVACFAAGFIGMAFIAAGPLFARARGLDLDAIAVFMGVAVISGLVLQLPIGRLSEQMDRRKLIAIVSFVFALLAVAMISASRHGALAATLMVAVYGAVGYTLYPLALTHANDMIEPHETVALSGGLIFASALGSILGPIAATGAMSVIGPDGLFAATALMAGGLGLFAIWRVLEGAPVVEAARTGFVATVATTPAVAELDPRVHPEAEVTIIGPDEKF